MANEIVSIPYRCPNCNAKVGELVEAEGGVRIDDGLWLIQDAKRHCHRCGRLIHFKAPRESWVDLTARHRARQEAAGCLG